MRMKWSNAVLAAALAALPAMGEGLKAVPDSVRSDARPDVYAFDTVMLVNDGQAALRVDSITIRFLDGGTNPKPGDFTACKTCPRDTLGAYVYGGWLYGTPLNQSLGYLRDSLFLIQDSHGLPVSLSVGAGASVPFALFLPVNCPYCGRPASFPGSTRYAFTFIASDGSRAGLKVAVAQPTRLSNREPRPARTHPGRIGSRAAGGVLYR
jgi:hypothetical protein